MMRRVASMPSSSGMRMSMSTTSGSRSLAIVTAWAPSAASPTTSRSSSASRIILNPARTSAWSSAIRMRTVISGVSSAKAERGYPRSGMLRPTVEWNPGADLEAAGALAAVQLAPEDAHALAHADEAVAAAAQATGRPGPGPPIADVQLEVLKAIGDVDLGRCRGRVLDGVGDRLLNHAIGGVLDALGAAGGARHPASTGAATMTSHPQTRVSPSSLVGSTSESAVTRARSQQTPATRRAPEARAERVGDDEGREVGPDERRIRLVAELLHGGERREDQGGGNERRATPGSHAKRHDEGQAAHGEDRARRRVEKGQLDLRLQQESSRQQQVGTAGRQGVHARPRRRQCPHGRTVTAPRGAIVVRSGDRGLILKDDAGSSRRDAQIAPMGDDAGTRPWDRHRP